MKKLIVLLPFLLAGYCHADVTYKPLVKPALARTAYIEVQGTMVFDVYHGTYTRKESVPVQASGSGAVISANGIVLTCAHVLDDEINNQKLTVVIASHSYMAFVIAKDDKRDLALVKVFPLHPLEYFVLSAVSAETGDPVMAVGFPLGVKNLVSYGYVETISVEHDKSVIHSAGLNPGNSGGPLVNMDGQLIGINEAVLMENMFVPAASLGLAIDIHTINEFLK